VEGRKSKPLPSLDNNYQKAKTGSSLRQKTLSPSLPLYHSSLSRRPRHPSMASTAMSENHANNSLDATSSSAELPNVSVKQYLESIRDTLAERIIVHAKSQVQALMEEFEIEKKSLLEDVEQERVKKGTKKAKISVMKQITVGN